MADLTPETLAELQRLLGEFRAVTPGRATAAPFSALVDALLTHADALLDSADRLVHMTETRALSRAARDALAAELSTTQDALNNAVLYENEARDALARQTPVLLAAEAALARVRELADRIDRHTEVEPDPAMFRDADTGVWWEVSDAIRAALDVTPGGE